MQLPSLIAQSLWKALALFSVTISAAAWAQLSITPAYVENAVTVDWAAMRGFPVHSSDAGQGTIPVVCYTGKAFWLSATGTNSFKVEYSTDLLNWAAFPSEREQLSLSPGNPFLLLPQVDSIFFRGKL